MRYAIIISALILAGCNETNDGALAWYEQPSDPQVYAFVNDQCLSKARGPQATTYNDWAEAIEECRVTASSVSRYCPAGKRCSGGAVSLADVRKVLPTNPHQGD